MSGVSVLLADGGHSHGLSLGISIGPLVLRVALLTAIPVVAGFALLRGFLGEPDRRTAVTVVGTAGGAAVLVLLLSGGLDLPAQLVPLLLAALTVPLYLILSTDPRFTPAVDRLRRSAPWVFGLIAAVALVMFGRAWLDAAGPAGTAVTLHTGAVLALVGLAWFTVARPRTRGVAIGLRIGAAMLGMLLLAGTAQAIVLRQEEPVPASALSTFEEVIL